MTGNSLSIGLCETLNDVCGWQFEINDGEVIGVIKEAGHGNKDASSEV